jgi:outer membrane protein assembly factor BamB
MFQHDPQHTGLGLGSGAVGRETWAKPVGNSRNSNIGDSVTVGMFNGVPRVYTGSMDGNVYAVRADNGTELWSRQIANRGTTPAISPDGNTLHVGARGGSSTRSMRPTAR